jgi:hypothetical protein
MVVQVYDGFSKRYAYGSRSTLWTHPLQLLEIPVTIQIIGPAMLL